MTKRFAWTFWSVFAVVLIGGLYLWSDARDVNRAQVTCRMESTVQSAPPTNILVRIQPYKGEIPVDLPSGYSYGNPVTIGRIDKNATYMITVGPEGQGLIVNMGTGTYATKGFIIEDATEVGTGKRIECEPVKYEIK